MQFMSFTTSGGTTLHMAMREIVSSRGGILTGHAFFGGILSNARCLHNSFGKAI